MMENQPGTAKPNAGQTMGIAALILGIIAIPLAFIPCTAVFAWIPAALAIIFGAIGYNQAKKGGAKTGLPIAGLILGIISAAIVVAWIVLFAEAAREVQNVIESDSTLQLGLDSAFQQMDSVMNAQDSTQQ